MKTNQFFVGNIMKCKNYEEHNTFESNYDAFYIDYDEDLVKEKAILIKLNVNNCMNYYIDIESINSILDLFKVYKNFLKAYNEGKILSIYPEYSDMLFIDSESLKPYYAENQKVKKTSLRQFKKNLTFKGCDIEW